MQSKSPLLRQWLILRSLQAADGRATVKWLREQTGVSEKTIRRDLDLLRRVGFPVSENTGEYGRKTFSLDSNDLVPLRFTYDEALALFFCRRLVSTWDGSFFAEAAHRALAKVQATLGDKVTGYVNKILPRIIPTGLHGNYGDKSELINQLLLGVEECKAVFVTYHSARSTEPVTYDVHPYGIVDHRGSLYLVGFSVQHEEIRHWKLDRMQDAEVTKVPFQRPADFDLQRHLANSLGVFHGAEPIRVRVRFSAAAARYVREKRAHASQQIKQQPDGSSIVEFHVSHTPEIKSWLLSFGPAAEVLEPITLRDEIRADIQRMAIAYESTQPPPDDDFTQRKRHPNTAKKSDASSKSRRAK